LKGLKRLKRLKGKLQLKGLKWQIQLKELKGLKLVEGVEEVEEV
jgi:hypothetical protein